MKSVIVGELESYLNANLCEMSYKKSNYHARNPRNMHDNCHFTRRYWQVTHSIRNVRYSVPRTPVAFHNGSKYDFHLMIKQLTIMLDSSDYECLGKIQKRRCWWKIKLIDKKKKDESEKIEKTD